MTLSTTITNLIPASGCTLKALRAALHRDHPHVTDAAIDHALVGMKAIGSIRVMLGTVTKPAAAMPEPMPPSINPLPQRPLTPQERVERARLRSRAWRIAHPERNAKHQRDHRARHGTQRQAVERGSYAAQRIAQIKGEAG